MQQNKTYHVFSRNNDTNGNPYRLVVTYIDGKLDKTYEARSSSPNIIGELYDGGYREGFRQIHLTPGEYNSVKKFFAIQPIIRTN